MVTFEEVTGRRSRALSRRAELSSKTEPSSIPKNKLQPIETVALTASTAGVTQRHRDRTCLEACLIRLQCRPCRGNVHIGLCVPGGQRRGQPLRLHSSAQAPETISLGWFCGPCEELVHHGHGCLALCGTESLPAVRMHWRESPEKCLQVEYLPRVFLQTRSWSHPSMAYPEVAQRQVVGNTGLKIIGHGCHIKWRIEEPICVTNNLKLQLDVPSGEPNTQGGTPIFR